LVNFQKTVLTWFKKHGRKDLPWQQNISAYRVWLSEIMLQQTQVKTVIPYFQRFTQRFPTIESLAAAPQDEVLHYWTGLGYYARARNLHAAAKMIMNEFNGIFPDNIIDIISLPGIGRSTAGAISSIAFNKAQPILDGNVKRVLSRYCASNEDLWPIASDFTPEKNCADYTQAMMDLGATICKRTKPKCDLCPLQKNCQAHQLGQETDFPPRKAKKTIPVKKTIMLLLQNTQGEILLLKQPPSGIWGGLWLLPQCVSTKGIKVWCQEHELDIKQQTKLPAFRHTFSHYHLDIQPIKLTVIQKADWIQESGRYLWYNGTQQIGLPAPIKSLLEELTWPAKKKSSSTAKS
jgi:A/G-specific adenine glycosylase